MFDILRKVKIYGLSRSLKYIKVELYRLVFFRLLKNSYSQQGEDLVIDQLLNANKSGLYVDIGAHDPNRFSNTKRFYDKGWSGINIDPNPELIDKFKKERKRDTNLAVGIGKNEGSLIFYEFFPSTLSTFSDIEAKKYVKDGFKLISKKNVPVTTLKSVLDKYCKSKTVDFFSIDTEGTDLEVLESNNWERFRPKIICVETKGNFDKISKFLKRQGYQLKHNNGINSIFSV